MQASTRPCTAAAHVLAWAEVCRETADAGQPKTALLFCVSIAPSSIFGHVFGVRPTTEHASSLAGRRESPTLLSLPLFWAGQRKRKASNARANIAWSGPHPIRYRQCRNSSAANGDAECRVPSHDLHIHKFCFTPAMCELRRFSSAEERLSWWTPGPATSATHQTPNRRLVNAAAVATEYPEHGMTTSTAEGAQIWVRCLGAKEKGGRCEVGPGALDALLMAPECFYS